MLPSRQTVNIKTKGSGAIQAYTGATKALQERIKQLEGQVKEQQEDKEK